MKKLLLLLFLMMTTKLWAQGSGEITISDKQWKQVEDVVKATIEKTKRSQEATFEKPQFSLQQTVNTNAEEVSNVSFR